MTCSLALRPIAIFTLALLPGAPAARAEPLTIQGSSTVSTNILTPNQAVIEALSGQALKIVGIRSDLGLLRLLAGQAEFAVISSSLKQVVASLRINSPDLPYDKLWRFRCPRSGSRSPSIRTTRSARPTWVRSGVSCRAN